MAKPLSAERMRIILQYQRDIKKLQKEAAKLPDSLKLRVRGIVDNRRGRINNLILETVADPKGTALPARSAAGLGQRIAAEINLMIDEVSGEIKAAQAEAWKAGAKAGNELLKAATLESGAFFAPPAELFTIATAHSADLIVTIGRELIPKVNSIISRAVLGGVTPFEAMKNIDALVANGPGRSGIHRTDGRGGASYQAERIVRTEVNRVYSVALDSFNGEFVNQLGPEASKKLKKRWVFGPWREGRRSRHQDMDGEEVPMDETFSNGLKYPRDPAAFDKPEEVINCGCTWVIVPDSVEEAALEAIKTL